MVNEYTRTSSTPNSNHGRDILRGNGIPEAETIGCREIRRSKIRGNNAHRLHHRPHYVHGEDIIRYCLCPCAFDGARRNY